VVWKEKVSDADYAKGQGGEQKSVQDVDALPAEQRAIVPIAALTAKGDLEALKRAIVAGLDAGLTINVIKEVQIISTRMPAFRARSTDSPL
jgi:alkylhydroperoxidase/carboxymuconolactone decarboxylase family protein YurZ